MWARGTPQVKDRLHLSKNEKENYAEARTIISKRNAQKENDRKKNISFVIEIGKRIFVPKEVRFGVHFFLYTKKHPTCKTLPLGRAPNIHAFIL